MKYSGTIFKQVGGLEAAGSELTQMRRQREAVEGPRGFRIRQTGYGSLLFTICVNSGKSVSPYIKENVQSSPEL